MVLGPHLTSLPFAVQEVDATIQSFGDKGWYESLPVLLESVLRYAADLLGEGLIAISDDIKIYFN